MIRRILGLSVQPVPIQDAELPRSDLSIINDVVDDEFVDVDALAAKLGLGVELHPYRKDLCGTLQRLGDRWTIGVNRADTFTRRRFTIAHEIGHYVMHRDLVARREGIPGIGDDRSYRQPDIPALANEHVTEHHERQATSIAIMILMGERKMRRLMAEGMTAEHMAPLIGCAAAAVAIRIDRLMAAGASGGHAD